MEVLAICVGRLTAHRKTKKIRSNKGLEQTHMQGCGKQK